MRDCHMGLRRIIAYTLVTFLVIGLLSGSGQGRVQKAHAEGSDPAPSTDISCSITVPEPVGTLDETSYYNSDAVTVTLKADFGTEGPSAYTSTYVLTKDGVSQTAQPVTWQDVEGSTERTCELPVSGEGTYEIALSIKDNSTSTEKGSCSRKIVIDKTAPVVEVQTVPENGAVSYQAKVNEASNVKVTTLRKYLEEQTVTESQPVPFVLKEETEPAEGEENAGSVITDLGAWTEMKKYTADGIYSVSATAADIAGNASAPIADSTFTIDKTAPMLAITGLSGNTVNGTTYCKEEQTITLWVADLSPAANLEEDYVISVNGDKQDGVVWSVPDGTDPDKRYIQKAELTLLAEGSYEVSLKAKDAVGNENASPVTAEFVIDTTAPKVPKAGTEITVSEEDGVTPENYYMNSKTTVSFQTQEANWETAQVYVTVKKDGNEITESRSPLSMAGEDSLALNYEDEGSYEITFRGKDAAGNESESPVTAEFVIDTTAPEFNIKRDNETNGTGWADFASNSDDNLFKENQMLQFMVTDKNHKSDSYKIEIVRVPEAGAVAQTTELTGSQINWSAVAGQADSLSFEKTFTEDGQYTVTVTGTDKAGNVATTTTVSFVIDRKAPVIQQLSDTTIVEDGCYNSQQVLKYSIKELNYQGTTGKITITRVLDGVPENTEIPLTLSSGETSYEQDFSEDGNYTVSVTAKDKAGNEATLGPIHFVIDTTKPVFTIKRQSGTDWVAFASNPDNNLFKENQKLQFMVKDRNHDRSEYQIRIVRVPETGEVAQTTVLSGAQITWQTVEGQADSLSFEKTFQQDGQYTVTITGQDKAGNVGITKTVSFVIDRKAPVIRQLPGTTIQENGYYNSDSILKYAIKELNYQGTTGKITITRVLDGVSEVTEKALTLRGGETDYEQVFSKEGYYTVSVTAKDKAGNEATPYTIHFVIDKTAPQLSISGIADGGMQRDPVTLTFAAKDRNLEASSYNIHITRTNVDGLLETYDINGDNASPLDFGESTWSRSGYPVGEQRQFTSSRKLRIQEEGQYEVRFTGYDKAGNIAVEKVLTFSVDRTAPVISHIVYSDGNGVIGERLQTIFSNQTIRVEFTVHDSIVGVDENQIYVTVGAPEDRGIQTPRYRATKVAGERYCVYIPSDIGVTEFDDTLTVWASDRLANESCFHSTKVLYSTDYAAISMECDMDYTKWTNQDVTFHTVLTDEKAGLKKAVFRVNDKVVGEISFEERTNHYEYDVTATESATLVTGYTVSVEVTNNCGTVSTMERQVYIDKVKPKVSLSGIKNGTHYNENQTFHTQVEDVSYNQTRTVYVVTRTLDGKTVSMSLANFDTEKYEDGCNRKLLQEGKYKVYGITTDGAGNKTISNTLHFVIDKTAPKLSVSGVSDEAMSGEEVTIDFGCVESFYATNSVSIRVERTLDGETVTSTVKGFPKNAKNSRMKETFAEDGTYRVTISATDKAGNVAKSKSIRFSVDKTKPEIQIIGTTNYELWNQPVEVQIRVDESYYSGSQVTIQGTRTDIDGNVTELSLSNFVSSGKVSALSEAFAEDGIYALTVHAKDEAGNEDQKEIHFTVDQTRPLIHKVGYYNGGYYQDFKLSDTLQDIFEDLTVVSYRILLNGVEYNGTDTVADEGKYNLFVEVADELGHITQENVEFIIDHTAPKVIFGGVKDGERVHDKGSITVSLTNTEDEITAIRVNGEDVGADTSVINYSEYGSYRIEVDCVDKAGNQITRDVYFVYSNPVTVAILLGGLGALTLLTCIWLGIRTRRKEKEEKGI